MSKDRERFYQLEDGKVYVTTSLGVKVRCLPYADMLMRAGILIQPPEEPSPPTFMRASADGEEYPQPYTQEEIDANPNVPDDDKAAWAAYLLARDEYETALAGADSQRNEKRMAVLALKATRIEEHVDYDAWAEEQETLFGIPVPDDPKQRRIVYFATEVAVTKEDGARLMAGVLRASGLSEEALDHVEDMFRDQVVDGSDAETGAEEDRT